MNNPEQVIEGVASLAEEPLARQTGGLSPRSRRSDAKPAASTLPDPDEDTPLLAREETASWGVSSEAGDVPPPAPEWPGTAAFDHLPWYRRPSVFWILPSLFAYTLAFGGIIVPKLSLIINLICRDYFADRAMHDPDFTVLPVLFNGQPNPQCKDTNVQKLATEFTMIINLISGLVSMVVAPKLGVLSDRYGRTRIIAYTGMGVLLNELITLLAASYPETIATNWILLGAFLDGLSGTFIAAMVVTNAYAADCEPPARRAVVFGRIYGCVFTGIALGPFLASIVMEYTGSALSYFYIALAVHSCFLPYILLIVPESLSKDIQRENRARGKLADEVPTPQLGPSGLNFIAAIPFKLASGAKQLVEPLSILWPRGPGATPQLRRNLALLAAIEFTLFGVAFGAMNVVVIYSKWMFEWSDTESSNFVGIVSTMRVFSVLVLLPTITWLVRGRRGAAIPARNTGSDKLDVWLIRIAITLDIAGFVGYTLARHGGVFIASGCFAAIGGFGSPTMQSSLTKHVPPSVVGQLLGAMGLLNSFARVIAPLIFSLIYAETLAIWPQTVFASLGATFLIALTLSMFLKSHVYYEVHDGDRPAETAAPANERE